RFRGCSGKGCEFAEAYVMAHEVGHHVQNLLGILPKAQAAQRAAGSKAEANSIQVRVELQADCLAGVWANHSNQKWNSLEPGDVEAAMQTAAAIGDDRLQRQTQGYVVPDAFTHGSSAQRQRWFMMGFVFDYISVNAFWTIVLIVHALLAVATLGALTHQAMSVAIPARQAAGPAGFVMRFRGVYGAGYATAICVLWVATFVLGAWIYTKYRIAVRIPLERTGYWKTLGFFELKEHIAE